MRPRLIAAIAAVLLLALTGCGAAAEESGYTIQSAPEGVEPTLDTPAPPLVAETPTAEIDETAKTPESEYLREVRAQMEQPISQIPKDATDEQLLAAASKGCELMATGALATDISLVEGETRDEYTGTFRDSGTMLDAAQRHLCPDVTPNVG